MLRIFIADYHAIVRERLKQILSESPDMAVVAEASNRQEVMDRVITNDYDLVILDIDIILETDIPGKSSLDILKEIKSRKPKLPVLVLSMYPEEQYAVRVLKAGASGYLTTENAPDELVAAIRKIAQGKKYISSSLAGKLKSDF